MPDPTIDPELGGEDDAVFLTDTPEANLAIERGLGVGARELAAQRDPGRPAPAADEAEEDDDEGEGG
jgi:hypothetical protein